MPSQQIRFTITPEERTMRLDRWIKNNLDHLSYSLIQKCLRTGDIRVSGQKVSASYKVQNGDIITIFHSFMSKSEISRPALSKTPSPKILQEANNLKTCILYQDDDLLILNKPSGLATQGGPGIFSHVDQLLAVAFDKTHHLVHRLDRETSGLLIVALNHQSAARLSESFRNRNIKKMYLALVVGQPPAYQVIDCSLKKRSGRFGQKMEIVPQDSPGALEALTLLKNFKTISSPIGICSWVKLSPHTGRTHQLRIHCATMGYPIVGDGLYGAQAAFPFGRSPLYLHAKFLSFPHPSTGKIQTITAPLPQHMAEKWNRVDMNTTNTPPT